MTTMLKVGRMGLAVLVHLFMIHSAFAQILFTQPATGTGTTQQSSWFPPDGLDSDIYIYDDFTLSVTASVTKISWRGTLTNGPIVPGDPTFTLDIYPSIAGGSQPLITGLPNSSNPGYLVRYNVFGNGNATFAGNFNGTPLYDYSLSLPTSFQAAANTTYWLQLEAWDGGWGWADSPGGRDFKYFVGGPFFQFGPNNVAFTLSGVAVPEPQAVILMMITLLLASGYLVSRYWKARLAGNAPCDIEE